MFVLDEGCAVERFKKTRLILIPNSFTTHRFLDPGVLSSSAPSLAPTSFRVSDEYARSLLHLFPVDHQDLTVGPTRSLTQSTVHFFGSPTTGTESLHVVCHFIPHSTWDPVKFCHVLTFYPNPWPMRNAPLPPPQPMLSVGTQRLSLPSVADSLVTTYYYTRCNVKDSGSVGECGREIWG